MMSGILAQEAAQRGGEGHAALDVLLHLVDAGQADFHRVLDRGDVAGLVVQDAQRRVQGHGLARAGRAGDQDHAVGLVDGVEEQLLLVGLIAKLVDAQLGRAAVQDTQHDLLAEQCRQGAHAEVDLFGLGQVELDAPILRDALLGDVQLRHHLQARGDALVQLVRHLPDLLEDAVDAQAHPVVGFVGLEMDVGCALADAVHQHLVDELDHRRVFARGVDAGVAREVLVAAADFQALQSFAVGLIECFGGLQPQVEAALEPVGIDQDRLDRQVGVELDLFQRADVGGVGDADEQPVAALVQRQHLVLAQQFFLDQVDRATAQGPLTADPPAACRIPASVPRPARASAPACGRRYRWRAASAPGWPHPSPCGRRPRPWRRPAPGAGRCR